MEDESIKSKHFHLQSIFRSKEQHPSLSPPVIQPCLTMDLSEDEGDDRVTSSLCYSTTSSMPLSSHSSNSGSSSQFSFAKAELLTEGIYLAHAKALGKKELEIKVLHDVLDELKELHEEAMAVSEAELLSTKIELGFSKEILWITETNLMQANTLIAWKDDELAFQQKAIEGQEAELSETKTALIETKESLSVVSSSLLTNQGILQGKEEEIAALQKSMVSGKRSAQVIAGLLTLGALCSSSD